MLAELKKKKTSDINLRVVLRTCRERGQEGGQGIFWPF